MVDIVDVANDYVEQELARAIQAARGIPGPRNPERRTHCPDCGDRLMAHRLPYGICVMCAEVREARGRLG
jgi:hypothetical protein